MRATLLKAGTGIQNILNIIIVASSADVDARRLWFADAEATLQTRTQNSRISTSLIVTRHTGQPINLKMFTIPINFNRFRANGDAIILMQFLHTNRKQVR